MNISMLSAKVKTVGRAQLLVLGLGLLSACVSRADIEDLKKTQADILAKLDKMEKAAPAVRPAAPPAPPPGPDPSKTYAVAVDGSAASGPEDAWVTVIEFSDFQCPFCERASKTMTELREQYGNDLRLVFKHNPLPFHSRAVPAALAAECARDQNKFWPMHDKLFLSTQALADSDFEGYAKGLGLDAKKFKVCLTTQKHKKRIDDDQAQARNFGARGTPTFFVNGHFISGAQRIETFKTLIDAELQRAKQSKLERAQYYSKAIEEQGDKSI
jgi:protein-disulfide isomerase